jgi:hypothetical protein
MTRRPNLDRIALDPMTDRELGYPFRRRPDSRRQIDYAFDLLA